MTQTILGSILHPEYSYMAQRWREWRLTYESGAFYIQNYLMWHQHESNEQYEDRKQMTYVPAFAKEAVNEVRNAVWSRLDDVCRIGGSESYQAACKGDAGGVDRRRSTMSEFIGREILPELLTMRRVGVWVDMPHVDVDETRASAKFKHPYLCWYPVESIRSWGTDSTGRLTRILLKQSNFMHDEATGLPMSGDVESFRYAWLGDPEKGEDPRVHIREQASDGKQLVEEYVLDLDEIPFVQFEIQHSLLEDVCYHQKALLNMESADVWWCIKANFPIWTAQFDPRSSSVAGRPAQQANRPGLPRPGFDNTLPVGQAPIIPAVPAGQAKEAAEAKPQQVVVGPTTGVGYPKELERPGFVHPSPEPLTASMAKEMQIKEDIRRLVHLSVATLDPRMASAESKDKDDRGLLLGLCAIGAALQRGDAAIAHHWHAYEHVDPPTIKYPQEWANATDASRRQDAEAILKMRDKFPSRTAQKEISKQAVRKLFGHRVSPDVLDTVMDEIEVAQYISADVDDLSADIKNRLVSAQFASEVIRGYPAGETEKALEEQAKQLSIIAISQSQGAGAAAPAGHQARGLPAHPADESSKNEKKLAEGKTGLPEDLTRGFGQGNEEPLGSSPPSPVVDQN